MSAITFWLDRGSSPARRSARNQVHDGANILYGSTRQHFGVETLVPSTADRQMVHDAIYNELCHGVIREESRAAFKAVIARLAEEGAESVILGCTEIGLLISQADSNLTVQASTKIHAVAAVELALA